MLYKASFYTPLGETRIELVSNNYTDSWPMLRRLVFRKMPIDLTAQSLPLAVAILTQAYCGDVFELEGFRIGSEYADAIRTVLGTQTNVVNVDGFHRSFSTAEMDVVVTRAGKAVATRATQGAVPLARVDWSGDFVDATTRSSAGFAFGGVQTNAAFFAEPFAVSVAVGLLFGRDRCGTMYVSPPAGDAKQCDMIREALRVVGVTLKEGVQADEPVLAKAS